MELVIDTAQRQRFGVLLLQRGSVVASATASVRYHGAGRILTLVAFVLRSRVRSRQIRGIAVAIGSGLGRRISRDGVSIGVGRRPGALWGDPAADAGVGFTQLRAGAVAANALAYGYDVPVVGFRRHDLPTVFRITAQLRHKPSIRRSGRTVNPRYASMPNISNALG